MRWQRWGGILGRQLLIWSVMLLFGSTIAMALLTVALRIWAERRRRSWAAAGVRWRPLVDAFVLDGCPLPLAKTNERGVVLDLLLRYNTLLRGGEAERIIAYLEEHGHLQSTLAALCSPSRWKRAQAAGQLGRMRSLKAVEPLIRCLNDPSPDVRLVAARSLASIGDPRAIEGLVGALADPSRWTATTVASGLVEMGVEVVPTLLRIAEGADGTIPEQDAAAVTAVRVLGELRDPRAAATLVRILARCPDLNLRTRAAAALGAVGGPRAGAALKKALGDPAWQVRAQAATGLGMVGSVSAVRPLSLAMRDENWWVRRNCANALARLGERGRVALQKLSLSEDRYVRDRARAALDAAQVPMRNYLSTQGRSRE